MKFIIIDPSAAKVEKINATNLYDVFPLVGLKPGEVDFGTLHMDASGSGVAIVEYGLFLPVEVARYFSIGSQLNPGGAILFAFNGARPLYRPEANPTERRPRIEGALPFRRKATPGLRRTARP